jgi:hypothetical protein
MQQATRTSRAAEFGDFQTPANLAKHTCRLLAGQGLNPGSIVEPTCGVGNFLFAALDAFPLARQMLALEINPDYVSKLKSRLSERPDASKVSLICDSFFAVDWPALLRDLPEPVLVVGNPPWVTNAHLGRLGSGNLPEKANFQNHRGMDALTGKSNFDVSEWMLIKLIEGLHGRDATVAMLCKNAVARKVLLHAWRAGLSVAQAAIYRIDAAQHFDAAVEACLLLLRLQPGQTCCEASIYNNLDFTRPDTTIGFRDGMLLSNVEAFTRWHRLLTNSGPQWRSGIKHDCSAIMELYRQGRHFRNGLGEVVDLEDTYLFPMLKSSDVAAGASTAPRRYMLVPQRSVGADTAPIQHLAPRTWRYLQAHAERLARRGSSIYRNRPPFSVFGIGEYSFAPWKIAISGLYKSLTFAVTGAHEGKPVVLDDTCYFLPCDTEKDARHLQTLLHSEPAQHFLKAFIFWDAKRPVTVEVLRRLDLTQLACLLGCPRPAIASERSIPEVQSPPVEVVVPDLFG